MTNKRLITIVIIVALMATVVGGFVVYAALSAQLAIKGSAEFQPESWSVKFKKDSLSEPAIVGGAKVQTAPTLSDTVIENFKIILTQPGDSVTYTFNIENTGSLDAVLSTYEKADPSCTGTGDSKAADEALICGGDLLTYSLKYVGDDLTENGLFNGLDVGEGDTLKIGTSVKVELKLEYSDVAVDLPANNVVIGNLDRYLIYTVSK